jgi:UDP-GlcNAc:undecaprenyl-phosphate GlcNAc-1-phosphate transferase
VTRLVVVGAVAFAAGVVLTPLCMTAARRAGMVDRPGPLKPQSAPVPYLGGVAVFLAAAVGAAAGRPSVIAPLAGAVVLGALDDRFDLPASVRLAGQAAVGAGVAAVAPVGVGGAGGGVLVAVVAVVLMNGTNFLDGLDALAAGVVAVACVGFAVVLHGAGRDLGVGTAAALAAFLLYNRPPARVYLGDAGSYVLGASLAVLLAQAWAPGVRTPVSVAALALVAVPAAELAFAVVRRARARQPLTSGDRRHPYDLAVARGWRRGSAALAYAAAQAALTVAAVAAAQAHSLPAPIAVAVCGALVLVALAGAGGALSPGPRVPV